MNIQNTEIKSINQGDVPKYKLYSNCGLIVSIYFGGPLAIGILMSKNYARLGNKKHARRALFLSVLAFIVIFILAELVPYYVHQAFFIFPIVLISRLVMIFQRSALAEHLENKGDFESCWKTFGISILILTGTFAMILGYLLFFKYYNFLKI